MAESAGEPDAAALSGGRRKELPGTAAALPEGVEVGAENDGAPAEGHPSADEEALELEEIYSSKLSPEARVRLKAKQKMFEEVRDSVVERPADAAELLRSWIVTDAKVEA